MRRGCPLQYSVWPELYNSIAKLKTTTGERARGASQPARASQPGDGFENGGLNGCWSFHEHGAAYSTGRYFRSLLKPALL
jgi:hypothetical protein